MRVDQGSWLVTTEVTVEPDPADPIDYPIRVVLVAFPPEEWPEEEEEEEEDEEDEHGERIQKYRWGDEEVVVTHLIHHESGIEKLLGAALGPQASVMWDWLLNELRVPTFGSTPSGWQILADASETLEVGGLLADLTAGGSPIILLKLASVALFVAVVMPAAKALGRGFARRIDQYFDGPEASGPSSTPPHGGRPGAPP